MKKLFYTLAVLFVCTLSANAQKYIDGDFYTVPSYFTYNHKPYILINQSDGRIDIHDMDLNKVETVHLTSDPYCLKYRTHIYKDGTYDFLRSSELYLTQTFFNDDADWEYIEYDSEQDATIIKKTDGTVIGSIPNKKWHRDILVIDGVVYATEGNLHNSVSGIHCIYTLTELRKLILEVPNSVKAVSTEVGTKDATAYDISGVRVSNGHNGIVIKDGKKMIAK